MPKLLTKTGTIMKGAKDKMLNIRHGHGPRRGCNAVEKAIETRTRQASRKLCREG